MLLIPDARNERRCPPQLIPSRAVILTALPVEYEAVRAHLRHCEERVHYRGTIYEQGKFLSFRRPWDILIAQAGRGETLAALETERAISYFDPEVALFVGVAGGLKDVAVGDVVAGTRIYGYECGKARLTFHARPEVHNCSYRMVQRAQAEARKGCWLRRLEKVVPHPEPRVFVAPIAAGEKVVASTHSAVWKFLRSNYEDALAVDMEDYGFLQAVYANHPAHALVVRGISDLIDCKDAADLSGSHLLAARNASAFAFQILAELDEADLGLGAGYRTFQKVLN